MVSIDDVYKGGGGGQWMSAADVKESDLDLTIDGYQVRKNPFKEGQNQYVLSFKGTDKKLPLNFTNASRISKIYGKEADDWIGKRLMLYLDTATTPQGKEVDALRVRVPRPARAAPREYSEIDPPDPETAPADEGY